MRCPLFPPAEWWQRNRIWWEASHAGRPARAKTFPLTGSLRSHSVFIACRMDDYERLVRRARGATDALTPTDQCVPFEAWSSCWHQLASALADSYSTPTLVSRTFVQPATQTTKRLMLWCDDGLNQSEFRWTPAMETWRIALGQMCHL